MFGVAIAVAAFLLRGNARMRYALWFAASVKFLVPFCCRRSVRCPDADRAARVRADGARRV